MGKRIKIFVEGIADEKFLSDYISYITPAVSHPSKLITNTGGWTKLSSGKQEGEAIRTQMIKNIDEGGINLIIFDADADCATRKQEIETWGGKYGLKFEIFLFPNNSDTGALEELLEKIILDKNQPIFDCWDGYETCLQSKKIEGRANSLTTPAKKTKIYGYLEALLGTTKKEKELIKERERDYTNKMHWNLDAEYLTPLKDFLLTYLT